MVFTSGSIHLGNHGGVEGVVRAESGWSAVTSSLRGLRSIQVRTCNERPELSVRSACQYQTRKEKSIGKIVNRVK